MPSAAARAACRFGAMAALCWPQTVRRARGARQTLHTAMAGGLMLFGRSCFTTASATGFGSKPHLLPSAHLASKGGEAVAVRVGRIG